MHSQITEETQEFWDQFVEGSYDQGMIDELEDIESSAPEKEGEGSHLRQGGGKQRPRYYWDAKILRMLIYAASEDDSEAWDTLEELLVCNHGEIRPIAIGLSRLTEGLLISRFEELEREGALTKTLRNGAEELLDHIVPFGGGSSNAHPKDRLLAGFAQFLAMGKWDQLRELEDDLQEADEDHPGVASDLEKLMELETQCTLEKVNGVRDSDISFPYNLFLEIVEEQVREAF